MYDVTLQGCIHTMLPYFQGPQRKYTRSYAPVGSVIYYVLVFGVLSTVQHVSGFNGGSLSSTLEMFHASACDGTHVRIQCPPTTLISIQYASYGRSKPSSDMYCPRPGEVTTTTGKPSFRDLLAGRTGRRWSEGGTEKEYALFQRLAEDTNCVAVRSFEVMSELCERRPSCAVLASPDTFKEDPCFTTTKYIDVYYKCRPDSFRTDTACEGEELDIRCGRGDRMVISAAMFGRIPNGSEICPTAKAAYIRCELSDFVDAVRGQCHKKRSCHLEANETDWGKPCSDDISTYLTVTYACLPKKYVKDLNHKPGRRKKKRRKKKRKKKKKGKDKIDLADLTTESSSEVVVVTTETQDIPDSTEREIYEPRESVVTQEMPDFDPGSEGTSEESPVLIANLTQGFPDITTVQDSPISTEDLLGSNRQTTSSFDQIDITTSKPFKRVTVESSTKPFDKGKGRLPDTTSSPSWEEIDRDNVGDDNLGEEDISSGSVIVSTESVTVEYPRSDNDRDIPPYKGSSGDNNIDDNNNGFDDDEDGDDDGGDVKSDVSKDLVRGVKEDPLLVHPKDIENSWDVSTESGLESDSRKNGNDRDLPNGSDDDLAGQDRNQHLGTDSAKDNVKSDKGVGGGGKGKDSGAKPPVLVTQRELEVLCNNYTKTDVRWYEIPRPKDTRSIGFLKDWFSIWHFLHNNEEKVWLYFTLGMCGGIIILLVIILIRVCINFRRNIKARLDVSEPTHRNAQTNNHHSSLETPMLEHSDSIDRIEVVRFSPRSTLRSMRGGSHNRDIVNYYG